MYEFFGAWWFWAGVCSFIFLLGWSTGKRIGAQNAAYERDLVIKALSDKGRQKETDLELRHQERWEGLFKDLDTQALDSLALAKALEDRWQGPEAERQRAKASALRGIILKYRGRI